MRVATLSACLLAPSLAVAAPILPAGEDPAMDAHMARQARQFYLLNALPFGLSLDAHPRDEAAVELVEQFLAQEGSDDVAAVTGEHPFELLASYGEYGDLGFFGGIAVAATAYEYIARKQEGADPATLALARARVVRAAESWHIFKVVSGGGGLVARGIRRLVPADPGDPPFPGPLPELVPLHDAEGVPLPQPKDNGTWRADNSGGALPGGVWIWEDSCSKDQLVGQVFAMAGLYDAMNGDPDIDQGLVTTLKEDARLIGRMLMEEREISQWPGFLVGSGLYDLIIMDADGRPTFYHDLNPFSAEKIYLDPAAGIYNLFNAVMAVGVLTGLHHVSGDPALEEYLYRDLLHDRGVLAMLEGWRSELALDYIYMGIKTNFDDPDMSAIALWLALYHETDPAVRAVLHGFLEEGWWLREGETHTARLCKQPLWHAVYLGLTDRGTDPGLVEEVRELLKAFDLGPYLNTQRINCDADELAAKQCLAVDGTTILHIEGEDDDGDPMATEALDPSIRPPSNFNARSNPFAVNGGGGLRLNPGGDLLASYWILRALEATAPGETHRSPNARLHMPLGGWPETPPEPAPDAAAPDASVPDATSDTPLPPDMGDGAGGGDRAPPGGRGCGTGGGPQAPLLLLLLAGWVARRRLRAPPA
ncbi:MAG: hypothetical protein FJ098_07590 [Deltaproteobacteria bacterium]|nr:hypothetical protein [Deltaproteobacteria bacterium]